MRRTHDPKELLVLKRVSAGTAQFDDCHPLQLRSWILLGFLQVPTVKAAPQLDYNLVGQKRL